ncbi:MAG: TatD family hydrolase, partial [Bacteroidales bacterium]|nr:TatD family hydrolase [Bacteroidales bacterium]
MNKNVIALPEFFRKIDIHTHQLQPDHEAIINLTPDLKIGKNRYYSVGIHPWQADEATDDTFRRLAQMAANPSIVAIGETGLDKYRGPVMEIQKEVLMRHILLAESTGKPLIIHNVRCDNEILALHKKMNPSVPWIIHGFRGKPTRGSLFVKQGIYLSLGNIFNPEIPAKIPSEMLLHETDGMDPDTTPEMNFT